MAMTTTEQNTFNQALQTNKPGTAISLKTTDGSNQYIYYRLVPIQVMDVATFTAFATANSVTVASP